MEGAFVDCIAVGEMVQKPHTLAFLGRRSFVPRPLSNATEIYDTDFEDDASDDASNSTLSADDILTPPMTGGLGGYEFHFDDKPVAGPYGPHLFRSSMTSIENELALSMSPAAEVVKAPPPTTRPLVTLNTAVAQLDETQVQNWTPRQVADWMTGAGFDPSVVDKFLIHDISGSVLLDMQFEDLKEIDIVSFGKRHKVMSSIKLLRSSSVLSPRALTRPVRSEERQIMVESPACGQRRGRQHQPSPDDIISPAESVSIVAIEQLLPKPHVCSKGDDCPKWKKQLRKIQRLEEEFAEEMKSVIVPSVVASSDVLGPTPPINITEERLNEVLPRDPQDNVRNFLKFQHVNSPTFPPPNSDHLTEQLNGLPRLTIPTENRATDSPFRTPVSAFKNPTDHQAMLKAELLNDPFHYGGVASPVDVYRVDSPVSVTDLPITALAIDPCERDTSQSVPPEMRYGAPSALPSRRQRRPSFAPNVAPVRETSTTPVAPPVVSEAELTAHSGWMRKRKTTRLMRHEWQDHYFALNGTKLNMQEDEQSAQNLESIDVDDYTLHAYATASSSKLSAAFKKSMGTSTGGEPTFAFSLIPEQQKTKKIFEKERGHHFAVNSGKDRVDWMRKLMLAKAMKKNDGQI